MNRAGAVALLTLVVISARGLCADGPELAIDSGRWLALHSLPPILTDPEIRPHLTSGLTTTLILRVEGIRSGVGKAVAGARIEIRYQLWEEVFSLSSTGAEGRLDRHDVPTEETLLAWWASLRLRVLDLHSEPPYTARKIRVTLEVVPFSHAEQIDTQRWFSESVHRGGRSADDTSPSVQEGGDPLARIFSVLIATSIQRRPLTSYTWTLDPPPEIRSP